MADFTSPNDLVKLCELLNSKQDENSDSEDEVQTNNYKSITPGNIQKANKTTTCKSKYKKIEENPKNEILDPEEYLLESQELTGWKKTPQWDLSYKQVVTPQDVFLQMGGKTPGTASCEDIIVAVHLPGEKRQNIDLKITKDRLNLVSPKFKLDIPLPHPVDPQKGNAEYDSAAEKLKITLRMDREFDYVNF